MKKTEKTKKDYKSLRFVDFLFTFNSKSNINEINKNNNINNYRIEERNYIKGKNVILYDLIEPIKLDYSIIKNHKYKKENESIYNLFYIKTNFFYHFLIHGVNH